MKKVEILSTVLIVFGVAMLILSSNCFAFGPPCRILDTSSQFKASVGQMIDRRGNVRTSEPGGVRNLSFGNGLFISESFINGEWAQTGGNTTREQLKGMSPSFPSVQFTSEVGGKRITQKSTSVVALKPMPPERDIKGISNAKLHVGREVMIHFYTILAIEDTQKRMDKYFEFLAKHSIPMQNYFLQRTPFEIETIVEDVD